MIDYEELGALKVKLVELESEVARLTDIEQQFRNIKQQLDEVMLDRSRLRSRVDEYINRNKEMWAREEALYMRLAEVNKATEEVNARQQASRMAILRAQYTTNCLRSIFGEANFEKLVRAGSANFNAQSKSEKDKEQAHD